MTIGHWRNFARGAIGIAIGAAFLWLALRQTSWEQVSAILFQSNVGWLFISLGFYVADLWLRVSRWRILLRDIKTLSFQSVGIALIVGYAANVVLPARLGELVRADFAGRRYRLSRSAIVGSILAERVLDGLIVVLCLVLGQLFIPDHPILSSLTAVSALLFIGIFIALLLLGKKSGSGKDWFDRFPHAISSRVESFRQGLSAMRGIGAVRVVNLSLIIWLLEALVIWAVLKAVNVSLGVWATLLVTGATSLSSLIPSAPGFVGTYQYAFAFTLGLYGYDPAQGIAAATAIQVFLMGSLVIVGLGLYLYLNLVKPDRS